MPGDLEFQLTGNPAELIAAIERVTQLASRMGAGSVNLQKVFEDAAKGAKELKISTDQAQLSLRGWTEQSKLSRNALIEQQAQIRKLEQAIRAIRDLPLATPQQLTQLRTLEQLYTRLTTGTRAKPAGPFDPGAFSLATTNVTRLIAELKGLDRQLTQLETLGKQIKLFSKPGVDPAIVTSLTQLKDTIVQTGALGKSAWNQVQASVRATAADVKDVTQAELEDARISGQRASARARDQARLRQEQAAAARQAQVDQEKLGAQINAILRRREADTAAEERAASRRAAAAERALSAEARASNQRAAAANREAADLNRIEALLARANKLRQTPAVQAFTGRLEGVAAGIGGGGTGPTRAELTALQGEMAALSRVTPIARSGLDALFGSFGRYVRIAASLTVTYGAMRAVMAQITFLSDLDAAMNKIAATMETQAEQAAKLPNSYALISTAMTKFGLSAEEAGSLVLELNRSLDGNVQLINGAFLPALALTTSGEVNQAEAVRTLVGIYNSYGDALLSATTPLEAMSNISDKILRASDLSVGSVGTFSQALTYLAASASNSNLSIDQTLGLLTLIQDSLGKASQSGTGLARVLEAITNNAQQIAEAFNIAFNPSGPVDVMKLMGGLVRQLKKEIDDLGGISQETAQKLQKFVPTEQGTRQIQRLIESYDQLEGRITKISEAQGRNARQLEARNKSLGVSFQNLLNSVLFATDQIINAIDKAFGGGGSTGGPGQYAATAKLLSNIADWFNTIGTRAVQAGTAIGSFVNTIGKGFIWIGDQIDAISQKLTGIKIPQEIWDMLTLIAKISGGALAGAFVAGPAGAIAGGTAAYLADSLAKVGQEAEAAKKQVEALAKSMDEAAHAEAALMGAPNKRDTDAAIARKTALDNAERAKRVKAIEDESRLDTQKNNQQLVMTERLAVAQGALSISSQRYAEAKAKYTDENLRSLLGEKDLEDATKKLQQLERDRAQDQAKVSSIRFEMQRAEITQLEEIRKLNQDIALAMTSDNAFDQIFNKSAAELENRMAQIRQRVKEGTLQKGFAETQLAQVTELTRVELTKSMQGVYDTIVTPFRDAAEASIAEIDKIVEAAAEAGRRIPNLAQAARAELAGVGDRAGEQRAGVPDAELQLRQSIATMGLYGAAAQEATALASKGFTTWTDAIIAANKALDETGAQGLTKFLAGLQKVTRIRMDTLLVNLQDEALKTSKALDVLFASASGDEFDLAGNLRALNETGQTIAELGQSADATRRQLGAMYQLLVETARTQAFGEKIIPQIRELDRAIAGAVASQTQFGAAAIATETAYANFGKSLEQVEPRFRALIEQYAKLAQAQKELSARRGLVGIGFSDEDAARMASVLSNFEQYLGDLNQGVTALNALNTASERWVSTELDRTKELARASNDWISFISAAMAKATAETGNYWRNLETLGTGVIQNLSSSFSDILFAGIKRDAEAAKNAVKNFFLAVARQITDFLASQAVGELKGLFTALAGGKAGTINVSASSSGAPGSSPSRPVYVSGADVNRPVGSGGTDYFGDVIGQPAATGGGGFNITAPAVSPYALVNGFNALKAGWATFSETRSLIAGYEAARDSYAAATAAAGELASAVGTLTAVVGIAVGSFNLLSDAYAGTLTSKSGALSGLSIGAGVGTLIAPGIGTIIGAAVGAAAGALAPYIPGVEGGGGRAVGSLIAGPVNSDLFRKFGLSDNASMIVASLLNPLGALGDLFEKLFGKASQYDAKRAEAADEANKALKSLSETYQAAARSVDAGQVLGALRAGQGGGRANNSVRSNLTLDPIVAQTVGIQGQIVGDRIIAQWSEITEQQFKNLLDYFKDNPDSLAQSIAGSGDVPYLKGEDAQKIADQAKAAAENLIKLYTAFKAATDKVQDLADVVVDTATAFLPPDLAARFEQGIVKPLQDKIRATLTSGLPLNEMTVQLTLLGSTLDSYAKLITLYGQLTLDFATLTGDYVKQLGYVRSQVELAREAATKAVEEGAGLFGVTQADVTKIDSGALAKDKIVELLQHAVDAAALSPELTVKNFTIIRDAVYARFELEKKLIGETETRIKDMYETHGKALLSLTGSLATLEINATGASLTMTKLLTHLQELGATSLSVSEKMYAANTAFKALLDTLPALISGPGRITNPRQAPRGGIGLEQIFPTAVAALGPYLTTLNKMIADSLNSGDLENGLGLIEQAGQAIVDAMNAAIAGVRQWESEEIARINETRDAQVKAIETARDDSLDYWAHVEDNINQQLKSIGLEKRGLQDQVDGITRQRELIRRAADDQLWFIGLEIYDLNLQKQGVEEQKELLRDQRKGFEDQKKGIEAQIKVWRKQADVLNDQLKVLQDQVDVVQEWASAVESLSKYILSLALSNEAPPDAVGQYQIAQSRFDALFQEFKGAPTAKKLQDLQGAASDLIGVMGNLFQRPSEEYRKLYESIVKRLEQALAIGEGFGTPATLDDLNEQIKAVEGQLDAVNQQIETLNTQIESIDESLASIDDAIALLDEQTAEIDKKIAALNETSSKIQHEAELQQHELELQSRSLEDQIYVLERQELLLQRHLEEIADEKKRITDGAQDQIDAIEDLRDKEIEAVHLAADAQIATITTQMMPILEGARKATADLLEFIRTTNYQLLLDLTGGQGSAAWMKRATENTEAWIGAILTLLSFKLGAPLVVTTATTPGTDDPLVTTLTHVNTTLTSLDSTLTRIWGTGGEYVPPDYGNPSPGGFAAGTMSVPETGVYQVHKKEVVIPMPAAEQFRREVMHWNNLGAALSRSGSPGAGVTPNVVIAPNVNINGLVESAVVRVIEDDIRRDGAVRRAVQRVLVGR